MRWNKPGIPHRGWECVDVIDLKPGDHEPYDPATCEMCGNESLRFVHVMEHPEYLGGLEVGCVCAEKMCKDYDGQARERRLVNRAKRRAKWLTREWRLSSNGNPYLRVEGYNVGVYPDKFRPGKWRWWVGFGNAMSNSPISYPSIEAAKLAVFDALANKLAW